MDSSKTSDASRIAEYLQTAKNADSTSAFLIGAGASITAKIPTATEFISEIEAKHSHSLASLDEEQKKNYGRCMARLTPVERETLLKPYLAAARLNWGHIALA